MIINSSVELGLNDLIAYGAHYHKAYKYKATQELTKADETEPTKEDDDGGSAFEALLEQLDKGFRNGHVYTMDTIVDGYSELLDEKHGVKDSTA